MSISILAFKRLCYVYVVDKILKFDITTRVFDKIFSFHQIGSGHTLTEPMYF